MFVPANQSKLVILISCLLLTIALAGCTGARTSGVYNEKLTKKKPYKYKSNGSIEKVVSDLNKKLIPKGFSIVNKDEYEGGATYMFEKDISEDEKFETTPLYEYMTGKSASGQKGRLVFVVSSTSGGVDIQMTPRLVAKTQENSDIDPSKDVEEVKDVQIPQGHPLPMKYGRILAKVDGWRLMDPPRSEVFMSEGGPNDSGAKAQASDRSQRLQSQQGSLPSQPSSDSPDERDTTAADTASVAETPESGKRPGDGGDDVKWVQETLNDLGHNCGPEDGVMGPKTGSCIRSFQKENDLEVTGKVNEVTYLVMLEKVQSDS